MSDVKDAAKILKTAVKNVDSSTGELAIKEFSKSMNTIPSMKIPFDLLPNQKTKDIMPYIKEFELDDPENMIRFLVELHFASFETISEGIASVRGDLLDDTIAGINSAKKLMRYADKKTGDKREQKLSECLSKLSDSQSKLEGKIKRYISEINEIDNRSSFSFFMKSKIDLKKVDRTVALATAALQAYFETTQLMSYLAFLSDDEDIEQFVDDSRAFIESLTAKKSISLMAAYDVKGDNTYWNSTKLSSQLDDIESLSEELAEFFEDSDEDEVDLENDVKF